MRALCSTKLHTYLTPPKSYKILIKTLKFLVPEVIKIKELKNGLKVAELFHGPTLAFKDLALGVVGGLYNYFLERSKKKCIVIVGKQHEA